MGEDVSRADGAPTATAGASAGASDGIEERFDALLSDFQYATMDEAAADRIGKRGFVAVIRVKEADHLELWCLFDGTPEVRDASGGQDADIEVTIPASLLDDFWDKHLALEILEGRASYSGPVRRLLQMMPVIRAAVQRHHAPEEGQA